MSKFLRKNAAKLAVVVILALAVPMLEGCKKKDQASKSSSSSKSSKKRS